MQHGVGGLGRQPVLERHVIVGVVHGFAARETGAIGDGKQGSRGRGFFGEEDAGFFEEFADCADAVGRAVEVAGGVAGVGREGAV